MQDIIQRLNNLLERGTELIENSSESNLQVKPSPDKWSKIEILGHLIDSGINNLQRFTEIQFESKPYKIRRYNQDELVKANNYNYADSREVLSLWLSINKRISNLFLLQSEETLAYKVEVDNGDISDLKFLFIDYLDHMEHHLKQIKN